MVNISVIIFERMNDLKLLRTCIIGSQFTEEPVFQSLLPKRGPVPTPPPRVQFVQKVLHVIVFVSA